jgi:hypothetical protein
MREIYAHVIQHFDVTSEVVSWCSDWLRVGRLEFRDSIPFSAASMSRYSSVGIALGYGWTIGVLGFDSRRVLGIFLFTTASRTALGPTQPPIQWLTGSFSLGVKRPRREADHSPTSSAEVKECVELYLHSPNMPSWHGAWLSTGTTLPLTLSPPRPDRLWDPPNFLLYTGYWGRFL